MDCGRWRWERCGTSRVDFGIAWMMASFAEWKVEMILEYVSILDTVCLCFLQCVQKETRLHKDSDPLLRSKRQTNHMHLEFMKVQKDSGIWARYKRKTRINLEQIHPTIDLGKGGWQQESLKFERIRKREREVHHCDKRTEYLVRLTNWPKWH